MAGENHIIKSFMIFTAPNFVRISNQKRLYGWGMHHAWETRETFTGFLSEKLKEGDRLDTLGIDVRIILKCALNKVEGREPNLPGSGYSFLKVFQGFRFAKRHESVGGNGGLPQYIFRLVAVWM